MSSISRKPESLLMSSRISQSKFKPCSHRTSELTFVDSSRTHFIFDACVDVSIDAEADVWFEWYN